MITTLITLLVLALVLYLVWYVVGMFVKGTPHQIIGVILALIFLVYCLQRLGLLGGALK